MILGGLPMRLTLKQILEKIQMGEKLTFSQDGTDWIVFYIAREKMFMMDIKKSDIKEYKKEELYLKDIGFYFRHGYVARFD